MRVLVPGVSGGLIGQTDSANMAITNSFWDMNASGHDFSSGGRGLHTGAMQQAATFEAAGWDFSTGPDWVIDEDNGYPRLAALALVSVDQHSLQVYIDGDGYSTVNVNGTPISQPYDHSFNSDQTVVLTASSSSGAGFAWWEFTDVPSGWNRLYMMTPSRCQWARTLLSMQSSRAPSKSTA
jgi:hypothetical protein